jgi:hypothetical protein
MSNILPKKRYANRKCHIFQFLLSWHVYNEENKEKVKHDEEEAKIQEELNLSKHLQDVYSDRFLFGLKIFRIGKCVFNC